MADLYPTITKVDASRGAPMGRSNWTGIPEGRVILRKLPLTEGYDPQGAYWGLPDNLYYALDEGGKFRKFVRADSVFEARKKLWDDSHGRIEEDEVLNMLTGYLTTLLFGEVIETSDRESEYYDRSFFDMNYGVEAVTPEMLAASHADCVKFLELAKPLLPESYDAHDLGGLLYYCRQGHGVSFSDYAAKWGGYDNARKLTKLAYDEMSEVYVFLTEDERVAL